MDEGEEEVMTNIEDAVGFWFMEKDGEIVTIDMAEVESIYYSEKTKELICHMKSGREVCVMEVAPDFHKEVQRVWANMRRKP